MNLRRAVDEADGEEGGRYHRQTLISWWSQATVAGAHILVVGAGALGNEILKLLALTGAGRVLVFDFDRIERSNLSRSVLFRDGDEGRMKADVAADRARDLNPEVLVLGRPENLLHRCGLGAFHWADVVISGVDNREARVFINAACARFGKVWIDGAIEGLDGVVRAFDPAHGVCYECTMNATDRKLLSERRSCALLARSVVARGHVPTTAVAASIVASFQVQEAIKVLHGRPALIGHGLQVDGVGGEVTRVRYQRRQDCPGHDQFGHVVPLGVGRRDITLGGLLERAERQFGDGACLDLSRDVIVSLSCPDCAETTLTPAILGEVRESAARCPLCGMHRIVEIASSVFRGGPLDLARTPSDIGLPEFDVMVARHGTGHSESWLFDGDARGALGPLYEPQDFGRPGPRLQEEAR